MASNHTCLTNSTVPSLFPYTTALTHTLSVPYSLQYRQFNGMGWDGIKVPPLPSSALRYLLVLLIPSHPSHPFNPHLVPHHHTHTTKPRPPHRPRHVVALQWRVGSGVGGTDGMDVLAAVHQCVCTHRRGAWDNGQLNLFNRCGGGVGMGDGDGYEGGWIHAWMDGNMYASRKVQYAWIDC